MANSRGRGSSRPRSPSASYYPAGTQHPGQYSRSRSRSPSPTSYDYYRPGSRPHSHRTSSRHRNHQQDAPRRGSGGIARESTRRSVRSHRQTVADEENGSSSGSRWMRKGGDSGRRGVHPVVFLTILLRSTSRLSMLCNLLWPVVPVALAFRYATPEHHTAIFALSYVAMVPCANTVGFAGTELARKLPHVWGVLVEVTLGSIVEIVLFMVLLSHDQFLVIKAAVLGSILATMLLCLGMCFIVGGIKRDEQKFEDTISETGSGLLLTAGVSLAVPSIFTHTLTDQLKTDELDHRTLQISRAVALCLVFAYIVYGVFQARTHHGIYDAIFEQDEKAGREHEKRNSPHENGRLTMAETILALVVSLTLVTLISIALVSQIEPIVEKHGISDPFMGLILVPLVEKFAEHLGAINEAWDNQMNFALSHVLGATIQTALFNGPFTILVAWMANKQMDLTFEVFDVSMLLLAIITVGGFLRDGKSNYLEGLLCVVLYTSIAVAAFFYPNPEGH